MPKWLNRTVVALGLVSLFTDASSEMVIPLLPTFLTKTLGASAVMLGGIEGAAEATASLLKLFSGRLSDRMDRRPLVLAGYTISTIARPLVALATSPWHVLAVRMTDRTGKGIRSAPRDALLAGAVPAEDRGVAYSFHQAMDHAGAILGPVLALLVLAVRPGDLRAVFAVAAIPGLFAVGAIVLGVREEETERVSKELPSLGKLPPGLLPFLVPLALFTLGNASDVFLLLKAGGQQASLERLPLLWIGFHVVKVATSVPGGRLSDVWNRRGTIAVGWLVYALIYAGFAYSTDLWTTTLLFLAYGAYYGLTEGAEKALVASVAPPELRGTAFGWYNLTIGILTLPASLLFGEIWDHVSPKAAFLTGSALAAAAVVTLLVAAVASPGRPRSA